MPGTHRRITGGQISKAVGDILYEYQTDVLNGINAAGEAAISDLVKITKRTAPKRTAPTRTAPKQTGKFRRNITFKREHTVAGDRFIWYVTGKSYRLTHLLVHGHASRNGGRVPGNPFLANALGKVLPGYESEIEGVLRGDR